MVIEKLIEFGVFPYKIVEVDSPYIDGIILKSSTFDENIVPDINNSGGIYFLGSHDPPMVDSIQHFIIRYAYIP